LDNPTAGKSGRRSRAIIRLLRFIPIVIILSLAHTAFTSSSDVYLGEAYYMSGNLAEAEEYLSRAAEGGGPGSVRALYLLGRISLLTGDFRQSKEFFERSEEKLPENAKWKGILGIGDALYSGGYYSEATRRYREAKHAGAPEGIVELKIALCEMALDRHDSALARVKAVLPGIPVLSAWVGREEDFFASLALQGFEGKEPVTEQLYVLLGPLPSREKLPSRIRDAVEDVPSSKVKVMGRTYFRFGPFADPVEGMLLSENLRKLTSYEVRMIRK
jgi:tetratricopeptide (TPR) repeat protein